MKKVFTHFRFAKNDNHLIKISLIMLVITSLFFTGCYEWGTIFQPGSATINSHFDVTLTAVDDGNPDNDWTNPDLIDYGLFGALIPVGWDIQDSIPFTITCSDPSYTNSGILVYNTAHSQTLEDSIPAPAGYYWWGAVTANEASMIYFQSLSFTPRIFTDDQVGQFMLRYAIGDMDYWDRNPADDISDPIPITIIDNTGVDELLSGANVSIYPNPANDNIHVQFDNYQSEVVDMSLLDLTGKLILQQKLTEQDNHIRLSGMAPGIYFVKLSNGDHQTNHKIIIQ